MAATIPVLTDAQKKTIATNLLYVRQRYHTAISDPYYQEVAARESIVRDREMMIMRAALVNESRQLLSHWAEIKAEIDIPWNVHYVRMNDQWRTASGLLQVHFFSTNLTTWAPVRQLAMAVHAIVSDEDVFKGARLVGGSLSSETHPPVVPAS